jgi:hypothetical protein
MPQLAVAAPVIMEPRHSPRRFGYPPPPPREPLHDTSRLLVSGWGWQGQHPICWFRPWRLWHAWRLWNSPEGLQDPHATGSSAVVGALQLLRF